MTAIEIVMIVVGYLAMSFLTCGFFMADFQGAWNDDLMNYRSDLGTAIFLSLLPPAWIMCPFLTGFFQHGWRILPAKEEKP